MNTDVIPALAAYRLRAATAHAAFLAAPKPAPPAPYVRPLFPALSAYLSSAASRFAAHKRSATTSTSTPFPPSVARKPARALGSAPPTSDSVASASTASEYAAPRRVAWLRYLAERAHRLTATAPACALHAAQLPCAIPADVRARFARRLRALLDRRAGAPLGTACKMYASERAPPVGLPPRALGTQSPPPRAPPCANHAARCAASLERGDSALPAAAQSRVNDATADGEVDTFEKTRGIYAGKPDALYRRRTSRKYAAWRRVQRDLETAQLQKQRDAERAMRASRGPDYLQTGRKAGDTSFVPFLYELDSKAYAFSSRISQAPKLRKAMVDKYSAGGEIAGGGVGTNGLAKAHLAAETNPLFHTRVMNRFG